MAKASLYIIEDAVPEMVSVKINIRHKKNKKQIHVLNIEKKFWDFRKEEVKKKHQDSNKINRRIQSRLSSYRERIEELEDKGLSFDIDDILKVKASPMLSEAIEAYSSKHSTANKRKYTNLKDKILSFYDTEVESVDKSYVLEFVSFLQKSDTINSQVTVHRYINFLKTVLRNSGFNDQEVLNLKIKKGYSKKERLTHEELAAFENVQGYDLSRDSFLMSFYLFGSRIGDVLQLRTLNVKEDRIEFIEQKTQKLKTVPLNEKLVQVIKRYKGQSKFNYVLPVLQREWKDPRQDYKFQKHIHVKTAQINKDLKLIAIKAGIDKKITSHVARHTFATWSYKADVNSRDIQKMMNFSSLSMVENYLDELKQLDRFEELSERIYQP